MRLNAAALRLDRRLRAGGPEEPLGVGSVGDRTQQHVLRALRAAGSTAHPAHIGAGDLHQDDGELAHLRLLHLVAIAHRTSVRPPKLACPASRVRLRVAPLPGPEIEHHALPGASRSRDAVLGATHRRRRRLLGPAGGRRPRESLAPSSTTRRGTRDRGSRFSLVHRGMTRRQRRRLRVTPDQEAGRHDQDEENAQHLDAGSPHDWPPDLETGDVAIEAGAMALHMRRRTRRHCSSPRR